VDLNSAFSKFKKTLEDLDFERTPQCLSNRLSATRSFLMWLAQKELEIHLKLSEEEEKLDIEGEAKRLIMKGYHFNEREKILILKGSDSYIELKRAEKQISILRGVLRELERMLFYEIELIKVDMRISGQGHFDD